MPRIIFDNLDNKTVKMLSTNLTSSLSKAIDCPEDWFTFVAQNNGMFCGGEEIDDTVFVSVEWFDRGEKVKNTVAGIITDVVSDIKTVETVTIVFKKLEKPDYYENGNPY